MDLRLRFEGKELKARAETVNGVLWVHHDGRTFAVENQGGRKKRGRHGEGAGGDIESPMPGKVTKILKKTGDAVKKGDAVVVMEAMKMEYTLKSETDGVIEEIPCAVGDQVGLGQTLVRFRVAEGA
ncbi:MAG: acetyl-CoA carboxylase biotin carboxyl carrier protein subunit [Bdellovibrionaceae bacterium]|nr:acetyl-CoA carboxylase biotin carboxyl carrier protein subunit [Pseudobdellovibrionaceae bacterium]MBX3032624.1 acetyl-CoA carboxylase biotin carboxyl carrier protein subunit [Pseudobdellovibrionaceae bacterium]